MTHTRKWLLLSILESAGSRGVTTAECMAAGVGSRYSARLMELRDAGYVIESVRERDGSWRYTLLNSPDDSERGGREPGFAKPSPSTPSLSTDQGSLFEHAKGELGFHNQEAA